MYVGAHKAEHCVISYTLLIGRYYNTTSCRTVFLITVVCSINSLIMECLLIRRTFNMISFATLPLGCVVFCQPN